MGNKVEFICNLWGGRHQARSLYNQDGLCPTLMAAMSHGNTVPHIMVKDKNETTKVNHIQEGGS